MKVKIGFGILIFIILFQVYYIYNYTYSGYILNIKNTHEKNNIDYVLLSNNLELIKEYIPNNSDTTLSVFINNSNNKYNISLQYWYNKTMFYPINLPREFSNLDITDYSNEKFVNMINDKKVKYIVLVGKNTNILNITTTKDISLYEFKNNKLNLLKEYNIDLYSFENECINNNKKELFDKTLNELLIYINVYKNLYSNSAADYLLDYANSLYNNNEESKAMKYYEIYNKIGILKPIPYYNLAIIYKNNNNYTGALEQINYCIAIDGCPADAIEIRNALLEGGVGK